MDPIFLKTAIDRTQRAQRNYDLSKSIPQDDLNMLIYAATNSPSKQNEIHYALHVYTDQNIIKEIYNNTKKFTLSKQNIYASDQFGINDNHEFWQDDELSVKNSQIYSNVLFVYVKEEGLARCATHIAGKENRYSQANEIYTEQKDFSIGISVGELILTASLLGYNTGICSAMDQKSVKQIVGVDNRIKLLVGVGYSNDNIDRRLHSETLNKDVPKKFRTGADDEPWKFPSFNKNIKVTLNGN